ncbi:MAG: RluA family pseudouridine synthase [Alphaproteobacteria bacterium]|nr:RluA family pseudouridine synthase [Alphaproteobacteria bacterium]
MAPARRLRLTPSSREKGDRLDRFLAGAAPELSRSRLKRLIETGQLRLGGRTITDPSYRVKPGESYTLDVPAAVPATPEAQAISLSIPYEDDDLLVIDKPAGLVVHPAPGNPDRTLVNALLHHCGESLSGIGGVARPGIVHRLDKDTSGLMLAAKNDTAHRSLAAQLAAHRLQRVYLALVAGMPAPASGLIDRPIGRHPKQRKKMAVLSRGGKPARTRYKVVQRFGRAFSLVECRLETGRTHQIRVHLAALGHPQIGDPVYGGRRPPPAGLAESAALALQAFNRQALHAHVIGFDHPRDGKRLDFKSPLPKDFAGLIKSLEIL